MTFKERVHSQCMKVLENKISLLRQTFNDLKESASNETKSTAGDKHETALAMLQIEQENTNKQLENLLSQKLFLQKLVTPGKSKQIGNGTLVKTNKGYLFVSIALGKIVVDGTTVIALSPQSPLGSKLMGLTETQTVLLYGTTYLIESIE